MHGDDEDVIRDAINGSESQRPLERRRHGWENDIETSLK
jgi:hypothetical protein